MREVRSFWIKEHGYAAKLQYRSIRNLVLTVPTILSQISVAVENHKPGGKLELRKLIATSAQTNRSLKQ